VTASHFSKLIGLLNFPDSQPPSTTYPIKGVLSGVLWILGLLEPEGWIDGMSQESVNNSILTMCNKAEEQRPQPHSSVSLESCLSNFIDIWAGDFVYTIY
jgi:hypothetical protein